MWTERENGLQYRRPSWRGLQQWCWEEEGGMHAGRLQQQQQTMDAPRTQLACQYSVVRTVECNYQPKPKTPSLAVALTSLLLICSFQFRCAFQQPHTRPYVRIVYSLSWVFSKEHRPTGNELSSFRWLYHVSALMYHVTHDYEKTCFICTVTRVQGFKFVTFCHATAYRTTYRPNRKS